MMVVLGEGQGKYFSLSFIVKFALKCVNKNELWTTSLKKLGVYSPKLGEIFWQYVSGSTTVIGL